MSFDNVNKYLESLNTNKQIEANNVILSGPDTMKNILVNETLKLAKLENVSNELLKYLTDSNAIKRLSYREKQNLLNTITNIQVNSRDFIFKVAELSSKNEFLRKLLEVSAQPESQIIQSSSGEMYVSTINEESRKNLTELLVDVINDKVLEQD